MKADREVRAMIGDAEWRLRQSARNADSVEFRGSHVGRLTYAGSRVVCGEFNGQNGFGGMSEFRRFMMIDGKVPLLDEANNNASDFFSKAWSEAGCD